MASGAMLRVCRVLALTALVVQASAFPWRWYEFGGCGTQPSHPFGVHGELEPDERTSFLITDPKAADPSVPVTRLCAGGTLRVKVTWGDEDKRGLVTTSHGQLSKARRPECKRSSWTSGTAAFLEQDLTLDCDVADAVVLSVTSSVQGDNFHQASVTLPVDPSCAALACTTAASVGQQGTATPDQPHAATGGTGTSAAHLGTESDSKGHPQAGALVSGSTSSDSSRATIAAGISEALQLAGEGANHASRGAGELPGPGQHTQAGQGEAGEERHASVHAAHHTDGGGKHGSQHFGAAFAAREHAARQQHDQGGEATRVRGPGDVGAGVQLSSLPDGAHSSPEQALRSSDHKLRGAPQGHQTAADADATANALQTAAGQGGKDGTSEHVLGGSDATTSAASSVAFQVARARGVILQGGEAVRRAWKGTIMPRHGQPVRLDGDRRSANTFDDGHPRTPAERLWAAGQHVLNLAQEYVASSGVDHLELR